MKTMKVGVGFKASMVTDARMSPKPKVIAGTSAGWRYIANAYRMPPVKRNEWQEFITKGGLRMAARCEFGWDCGPFPSRYRPFTCGYDGYWFPLGRRKWDMCRARAATIISKELERRGR